MSTLPRPLGCPSRDDLSAVLDGCVPEEVAVHGENCVACQRDLAFLHRIDRAVRSRLAPPKGLADRIRKRVGEAAAVAAPEVSRWWLSPVMRLAAAVVITAAAIAVLVRLLDRGVLSGQTVVENGAVPGGHPSAIKQVSSGSAKNSTEVSSSRGPQSLPRVVRHVWTVVGNAAGERDRLQAMLPAGAYDVDLADGNTVFTVRLKDRDLQTLVDRLAADSKWQLASPELPQPRQPGSVAISGRDVRYSLVLVDSGTAGQ